MHLGLFFSLKLENKFSENFNLLEPNLEDTIFKPSDQIYQNKLSFPCMNRNFDVPFNLIQVTRILQIASFQVI